MATTTMAKSTKGLTPKEIIKLQHPEHLEFEIIWQRRYDSWEGGERYKQATYGKDDLGNPVYNLIRHKSEYPDPKQNRSQATGLAPNMPGKDTAYRTTQDDFELRRARTPVYSFVAEAVTQHLSKVYAQEVVRKSPDKLIEDWWADVDGRRTPMKRWISKTVAPLVETIGCLDVVFDHPEPPDDVEILTRADEQRLKLDSCIASHILPQNTVWWSLDQTGRYKEVLIRECQDDGCVCFRHWTPQTWALYSEDGEVCVAPTPHKFRRVPIVRLFDERLPRCKNVGQSRYANIEDYQREFYNKDSELILSDSNQSHNILQGPSDLIKADGTIYAGPNRVLPKQKVTSGSSVSYEGWDVITFPHEGADSIRQNKADLRDASDRAALLTKPAGAAGTDGKTVAQSGISKRLDKDDGCQLLTEIAEALEAMENTINEFAYVVLHDGQDPDAFLKALEISYPKSFDLFTAEELVSLVKQFQDVLAASGNAPQTETKAITLLVRHMLPGLAPEDYAKFDKEIEETVGSKSDEMDQQAEAQAALADAVQNGQDPNAPPGSRPMPQGNGKPPTKPKQDPAQLEQ